MNNNKNIFTEMFTMFGYLIGVGLILFYSLFAKDNHILLIIGLIIAIGLRFVGYGLDKIANRKK